MNLSNFLKNYRRAIILSLMIFFTLFLLGLIPYSYLILKQYKEVKANLTVNQITHQLNQNLKFVADTINNCSCWEEAIPLIEEKNITALLEFLKKQKQQLGLDALLATDNQGIVLTRTEYTNIRGDYLFNTTSWGETVNQRGEVVAIEKGSPLPMIFVAGRQLKKDNRVIGTIFIAKTIDQGYLNHLKEEFLSQGELILYSQTSGVLASTFKTEEKNLLSQSFFNSGTDWLNSDKEEKFLLRFNNNNYLVKNIIFPGINHSPGGLLILLPAVQTKELVLLTLVNTLLFTGFFSVFLVILNREKKVSFLPIIVLGVVYGLVCSGLYYLNSKTISIPVKNLVETVYNSTLRLVPDSGIFSKDYEHEVRVRVFPGGEAVNAFEVNLSFNPEIIQVKEIKTENSICGEQFFLEKTINNQEGKVRFSCVIPNPGFNQNQGDLAGLIVKPLKRGNYELMITDDSKVLANDSLGTNVLRASQSGSYQIIDPEKTPTEVLVFSTTHPNSNSWYRSREIHLSWVGLDKSYSSFSWKFDRKPNSLPEASFWTTKNTIDVIVFEDGIYYFHIAGRKNGQLGPVSHFQIKIDSTPPKPILIKASEKTLRLGNPLRLEFSTDDKLSGIQSYYLKLNDGIFFPVQSPVTIVLDKLGRNIITVRAFDLANNFRDSELIIEIKENNVFQKIIKNLTGTATFLSANLEQLILK